jgi:phosphopantetheine--protein transferase-like protein
VEAVAERIFSLTERQTLNALPKQRRVDAFFGSWTRKEAYSKGLGVAWGTFDSGEPMPVDLLNSEQPSVLLYQSARRGRWSLALFDAGAGFAAALQSKERTSKFLR